MSLTDASHSWALFLTKSLWWNQSHKGRIKSKVQGIPESKSLHEILRVWDTPTPDDQPETQRGNALERSAPEGIEQRQKARSSDSPSCCTLHPTQLAWTMPPLCDPSPPSQRVCLFQSYHPHTHTGWHQLCSQTPLTLYNCVRWKESQDQYVHTKPAKSWRKVLLHWWQRIWG